MKLLYLIIYSLLMWIITIHSIKKKYNKTYCAMWMAYAISSVFCLISKVFQEQIHGRGIMLSIWYDLSDTTLWGYLLIIVCCAIAFKPIRLFDPAAGDNIETENSYRVDKVRKLLCELYSYAYIALFVVFFIICFRTVINVLNISDFASQRTSLYGNSENETVATITDNIIGNVCFRLCVKFRVFSVFVAFAMLKDRYKKSLAILLLIVTSVLYYIYSSWNAARGGLFLYFICIVMIGFYYIRYLTISTKLKIFLFSVIGGIILASFFITVTISRFSITSNAGGSIFSNFVFYLGHGPIQFSKITGSLTGFAWGKTIIGRLISNYFGTSYSWESIQASIGYPPIGSVFVTYLGYLYTDFGVVSCLLFTWGFSALMTRVIKKHPRRLSTYYLLGYYINFYVLGVFVVGRLEYVAVISTLIFYIIFRLIEDTLSIRMKTGLRGRNIVNARY